MNKLITYIEVYHITKLSPPILYRNGYISNNTEMKRLLLFITEKFLTLLYHPLAIFYDLVAWIVSGGRWHSWILTALPYIRGSKVLELGYGTGHLQAALIESGHFTFGLDESRQMSRIAKARIMRAIEKGSMNQYSEWLPFPRLACGKTQNLPYPANVFSTIVATFPTSYIFDPSTLQEIYRTLQKDGQLVVIPNAWITGNSLADIAAAWLYKITGQAEQLPFTEISPFKDIGFKINTYVIEHKTSRVMLIIAQKT
jgi:ubiquinone/menaquinone biosynthesis C-methylase UbiE